MFKARLRKPRVSARFKSLKSISALILFVYKLMNESSKNNRRNYHKKNKPGLRANRPYIDLVIAFKAIVL